MEQFVRGPRGALKKRTLAEGVEFSSQYVNEELGVHNITVQMPMALAVKLGVVKEAKAEEAEVLERSVLQERPKVAAKSLPEPTMEPMQEVPHSEPAPEDVDTPPFYAPSREP